MLQKKEQPKNLQEKLNEEERNSQPEKYCRIMIIKMISNLRKRMEAQIRKIQEMFNKEPKDLKSKPR